MTDRLLPLVPPALGEKLVAFGVEAAGKAGERYADTDLTRHRHDRQGGEAVEVGR